MKSFTSHIIVATVVAFASSVAFAGVLTNPTITTASTEFADDGFNNGTGGFDVSYIFDTSYTTEYASVTQGINTFIEYDFGSVVTIGGMSHVNRNVNDSIDSSRLIFSTDATFGNGDDQSVVLTHLRQDGGGSNEFRFNAVDAQYVRWEMVAVSGPTNNQGSRYIRFHDDAEIGRYSMTHIADSGAFNAAFSPINAYNGITSGTNAEWATNGDGVGTFMDFDLGEDRSVGGFVYVQRVNDFVTSANLIFATDAAFTNIVGTRSVALNTGNFARTAVEFDERTARYVRFDVTGVAGGGPNQGSANMYFVPDELTPITATASTTFSAGQNPVNLINDNGLTGRGIGALHDNQVSALTMWHSSGGVVNDEWLLFDMGEQHSRLDAAVIWNHNQSGNTARGVDEFEILVSLNNIDFESLGLFNLDEASGLAGEAGQWVELNYVGLYRYIRFDINSAHSGNASEFVGLSEVRFVGVVPTPAALPAGLMLLGAMAMRRKK